MKLVVDKASLVSVADAIREKGNTTESLEFPNGFVDGINAIESGSGGGTEEIENIIDQSGVLGTTDETVTVTEKVEQLVDKGKEYNNLYGLLGTSPNAKYDSFFYRNDHIKNLPKLKYDEVVSMRYFCGISSLESVDYYINCGKTTDFYQAFYNCEKLKFVYGIDLSKGTNLYEVFKGCKNLETIQEPLDFSSYSNSSGIFVGCNALKNVRFVENSILTYTNLTNCSLLTNDSIKSIINGLAAVETTQTLTLNSAIVLTDEQKTAISNKGWTLVQ